MDIQNKFLQFWEYRYQNKFQYSITELLQTNCGLQVIEAIIEQHDLETGEIRLHTHTRNLLERNCTKCTQISIDKT